MFVVCVACIAGVVGTSINSGGVLLPFVCRDGASWHVVLLVLVLCVDRPRVFHVGMKVEASRGTNLRLIFLAR